MVLQKMVPFLGHPVEKIKRGPVVGRLHEGQREAGAPSPTDNPLSPAASPAQKKSINQ